MIRYQRRSPVFRPRQSVAEAVVPQPGLFDHISGSLRSGKTGGAATGAGVDYQTRYGTLLVLRQIINLRRQNPWGRPTLDVEPRLIGNGSVERWDFRVYFPEGAERAKTVSIEAKSVLSGGDVQAMLRRCLDSVVADRVETFELVYGSLGDGGATALAEVEKLIRLASESSGRPGHFQSACELETDPKKRFEKLLSFLGSHAAAVGERLTINHMPQASLDEAVNVRLAMCVLPEAEELLRNGLYRRLTADMNQRRRYVLVSLRAELAKDGVRWIDAGSLVPVGADRRLVRSAFVLQYCADGLPLSVLAAAADCSECDLDAVFAAADAVVVDHYGIRHLNPLPGKIDCDAAGETLGRAAQRLVEYIKKHEGPLGQTCQIDNVIALTKGCVGLNDAAAARVFGPLDKQLKSRGRKHDVLEMAKIAIECSRRAGPSVEMSQIEAKARVCGLTWVYQRVGELDKAETCAVESLTLGEDLGWVRNTAYVQKCRGRLRRVQAERATHPKTKTKLLGESRELLNAAIEAFVACPEHVAVQEANEVGDCHSLLGRTEMVAGRTADAVTHAKKARELITADPEHLSNKDYMDLLILEGDLAALRVQHAEADGLYSDALKLAHPENAEHSEIEARALLSRGRNAAQRSSKQISIASEMITNAAEIWSRLGDHHNAAVAQWRLIELTGDLPKPFRKLLLKEVAPVRVEAVRRAERFQEQAQARALAHRSEMTGNMLRSLIKEARKADRINRSSWAE